LFAKKMGGAGAEVLGDLALDNSNNIYLTGTFSGTNEDFDPSANQSNLSSLAGTDVYLVKYDAGLNIQWAESMGSADMDEGKALAVDNSGNVYLAGVYKKGPLDLDPGSATHYVSNTSNPNYSTFVAKYNSSGNYVWSRNITGTTTDEYVHDITLDGNNNLYLTGYIENTCSFDQGVSSADLTSNGNIDIYIAKYDANNNYLWAKNIGGSGVDYGVTLTTSSNNCIYLSGGFYNTVDFDLSASTYNLISTGLTDPFIAKYTELNPTGIKEESKGESYLYPNPATKELFIQSATSDEQEIKIFSTTGQQLLQHTFTTTKSLDISQLPAGMYYAQLTSEGKVSNVKFVKE